MPESLKKTMTAVELWNYVTGISAPAILQHLHKMIGLLRQEYGTEENTI